MNVVEKYLSNVPEPEKTVLQHIRQIILQTVPEAEEVLTYGMPGFKYKGKYLISFAAFKDHLSVFPGAEAVAAMKDRLSGYTMSKGTIQFTLENPLPDSFIKELVAMGMRRISNK